MNFKWQTYNKKSHFCGIKVMKNAIYFSTKANSLIGNALSYNLLLDQENNAIALVPFSDESGNVQLKNSKKFNTLNASIGSIMPFGRYSFHEKQEEKFIFLLENNLTPPQA